MTILKTKWISWLWWLGLGATAVLAGLAAQRIGLPGGWLIGPLIVALLIGLFRSKRPQMPQPLLFSAQAVIGIILSGTFRPEILPGVLGHWFSILFVVAVTLFLSIIAGLILARISPINRETATLGTLPGGATSIIALSVDSKADTRLVALMQYTRVVLVVFSAAILARFVLHPTDAHSMPPAIILPVNLLTPTPWFHYSLTAIIALIGVFAGRLIRLPAGALLGPLILGIIANGLSLVLPVWPPGVAQAAYILIGLYVGLLFDKTSLIQAGKLFPIIIANIVVLMIVCAATGKLLSILTKTSYLTGYLATTPGGMDSVAIVALGSGSDVSLVLAVQMVRLFAIILLGPLLARWMLGIRTKKISSH
ncbi:MAG: AbrB family transcriptional regulator [Desulfobacteraceae bacterium]|nr:MAG: AbrB family transcriptional regulator [Desulfobacteraceae bacterium]